MFAEELFVHYLVMLVRCISYFYGAHTFSKSLRISSVHWSLSRYA